MCQQTIEMAVLHWGAAFFFTRGYPLHRCYLCGMKIPIAIKNLTPHDIKQIV